MNLKRKVIEAMTIVGADNSWTDYRAKVAMEMIVEWLDDRADALEINDLSVVPSSELLQTRILSKRLLKEADNDATTES